MNLRWYAFLVLLLTLWAVSTKDVEQNRELRPIEITKVTKWTDAENVVGFTLTLLASQFIIASGWIIFGKLIRTENLRYFDLGYFLVIFSLCIYVFRFDMVCYGCEYIRKFRYTQNNNAF